MAVFVTLIVVLGVLLGSDRGGGGGDTNVGLIVGVAVVVENCAHDCLCGYVVIVAVSGALTAAWRRSFY